ncbi:MAG: hypothetical protein ACKO96_07850, partial [Flammeovirgaceae bacterium]
MSLSQTATVFQLPSFKTLEDQFVTVIATILAQLGSLLSTYPPFSTDSVDQSVDLLQTPSFWKHQLEYAFESRKLDFLPAAFQLL